MGSKNPSTQYIESAEVTSQYLLTVPSEVQDLIFPEELVAENKVYYWYLHETKSEKYIYISNQTPREENSQTIKSTQTHSGSPNRTSIPKKIRNKKNICKEDMLYFFAHDETKESENPSVAIFTEDQMASKMDIGIESSPDRDALLRPFTKFGRDDISLDDIIDEL